MNDLHKTIALLQGKLQFVLLTDYTPLLTLLTLSLLRCLKPVHYLNKLQSVSRHLCSVSDY